MPRARYTPVVSVVARSSTPHTYDLCIEGPHMGAVAHSLGEGGGIGPLRVLACLRLPRESGHWLVLRARSTVSVGIVVPSSLLHLRSSRNRAPATRVIVASTLGEDGGDGPPRIDACLRLPRELAQSTASTRALARAGTSTSTPRARLMQLKIRELHLSTFFQHHLFPRARTATLSGLLTRNLVTHHD